MGRKQHIVVFGGRGFVGRAVCSMLRQTYDVITFDRHPGVENHIQGDILAPLSVATAYKKK